MFKVPCNVAPTCLPRLPFFCLCLHLHPFQMPHTMDWSVKTLCRAFPCHEAFVSFIYCVYSFVSHFVFRILNQMSLLLSNLWQTKLSLFWVMIIDCSIITTGFVLCPWETICGRGPCSPNIKHSAWLIVAAQQMFVGLDWRGFSVAAGMPLPDVFLSLLWRVALFISGLSIFQSLNRIYR